MLRLLADENFPGIAVEMLRQHGHDVAWVRTEAPGISDAEVLDWSKTEQRLLLTFDKDFGELVFKARQLASAGIVLFRISTQSPHYVAQKALTVLESREDWSGHFSIIEETRIRMTPLLRRGTMHGAPPW